MQARGRWLLAAAFVALGFVAAARRPEARATDAIDYDTFMTADPAARRDAFARLSAEQKADLMRTHMERWRAAHERLLSKAQRQVVDDNIAAIAPDFYRQPTTPEWRNKAVSLFKRASEVFTRDEMTQLFTLDGEHVPEPR